MEFTHLLIRPSHARKQQQQQKNLQLLDILACNSATKPSMQNPTAGL